MGIGDASLAQNHQQLREAVKEMVKQYGEPALIEQFMEGREFTVGILGNGRDLRVFPVLESVFPEGVYYYRLERKVEHEREIRCPAEVSNDLAEEMERMAVAVYRALECRDFARVDFRTDHQGRPYFLEINPLPGLHPENGLFPQQAYAAGLSYQQLIGHIIEAAMARCGLRKTQAREC